MTPQHIYMLLLCITQQEQCQLQDSWKLIMMSLKLSNIQRPIVKKKTFVGLLFL